MVLFATGVGFIVSNFVYQALSGSPDFDKAAVISWHQVIALVAAALIGRILRRAS